MVEQDVLRKAEEVVTFGAVWRREPWAEVEPLAKRAWSQASHFGGSWAWAEVREFVKETWESG